MLHILGARRQPGATECGREQLDFLPAVLQIQERPASPAGRLLGWSLMALFSIAIIWACLGEVDIVAVAEGKVVSGSRIKAIQPLQKGLLRAIHVQEGEFVKRGQPLIELDQTVTQAEQARLAEELRFTRTELSRKQYFSAAQAKSVMLIQRGNGDVAAVAALDRVLPADQEVPQRSLLEQELMDYQAKINAYLSDEKELQAQLQANLAQINMLQQTLPLIEKRLQALRQLEKDKLVAEMERLSVEQEFIEQQQALFAYRAQQQQHSAAVESARQRLIGFQSEMQKNTLLEIDNLERRIHSLSQELAKARDVNRRKILYAPVDGQVQQLAIHTVGGVVTEAQVLMQLVPGNDFLEVEATLANKDVGFVFPGQTAEVKINTFNFTRYGVLEAKVVGLSADAIADEVKGLVYKLRLQLQRSELQIDDRLVTLIPGMAVTAEVKIGRRRLIEFVLSPLLRKANESARER
ncbi:HlyD family type I secretion periplasmic adaptor subunit [Pseudomaricurvus alcaniphilus]|uniref:HlyD family type I secretion periplasmic adaptor subunit n=1 Tax=Pseudomaricurvus alcaniphilus TaxID=1166482 RepID=UPI002441DA38|nr:HlyD family type I secretion periplasmic adaptor subunit [Pseudomaricurvus alcaniphilus]